MVKGSPICNKRCKNCEALWICHYLQYTKSSKDYKNQEKFLCARDKVENQYWRQHCIKIRHDSVYTLTVLLMLYFLVFHGVFSLISGELHSCFLPCSGSLVDKSAFNQQHHTHQAAAGILQDCTGEVWGVGNTLHRQIALQTDITVVA